MIPVLTVTVAELWPAENWTGDGDTLAPSAPAPDKAKFTDNAEPDTSPRLIVYVKEDDVGISDGTGDKALERFTISVERAIGI